MVEDSLPSTCTVRLSAAGGSAMNDRSFIKELEVQGDDDLIVRSTINLGHAMNLKVVAEGVELASSWDALGRLGCDLIQGYFVSKPLPIREFTAWMRARATSGGTSSTADAASQSRSTAKRLRSASEQ